MAEFVVRCRPNGPLVIEGEVRVLDHEGNAFATNPAKPVVALCRCGASERKPFCDGAHNKIAFQASNTAPPAPPAQA